MREQTMEVVTVLKYTNALVKKCIMAQEMLPGHSSYREDYEGQRKISEADGNKKCHKSIFRRSLVSHLHLHAFTVGAL